MLFAKLLLQQARVDCLVRVDCANHVAHVDLAGRLCWQAGVQWGVEEDLEKVLEGQKYFIQVPGSGCRNWQDGLNGDKALRRHSLRMAGAKGSLRDIECKASSAII